MRDAEQGINHVAACASEAALSRKVPGKGCGVSSGRSSRRAGGRDAEARQDSEETPASSSARGGASEEASRLVRATAAAAAAAALANEERHNQSDSYPHDHYDASSSNSSARGPWYQSPRLASSTLAAPAFPPDPSASLSKYLNQCAGSSTSLLPPLPAPRELEPKLDALLEAIKVVREGPASIKCTCKGTCRCLSCQGRTRGNGPTVGGGLATGSGVSGLGEDGAEEGCCGRSAGSNKKNAGMSGSKRSRAGQVIEGEVLSAGSDDSGPALDPPPPFKRTRLDDDIRTGCGPAESAPAASIDEPQIDPDLLRHGNDEETASQSGDDCATCGACDLDLRMPSGIAAVDEFAAAGSSRAAAAQIALPPPASHAAALVPHAGGRRR